MKKITLLLFTMLSLLSYSAKTVDYQEVDKYIRQKLDKDKEITFVYKLNSADNTLEGYSDEGKLTAVTDLRDNPSQAAMNGMKSTISEIFNRMFSFFATSENSFTIFSTIKCAVVVEPNSYILLIKMVQSPFIVPFTHAFL